MWLTSVEGCCGSARTNSKSRGVDSRVPRGSIGILETLQPQIEITRAVRGLTADPTEPFSDVRQSSRYEVAHTMHNQIP